MKTVLTIAGFDPSSGAGVTADLLVFAAHGLFGTSAITSLTVQSTLGVASSHPVDAGIVEQTLRCLEADVPAAGIKIGMLATVPVVLAVTEFLAEVRERRPDLIVVLDPVLQSSSGRELLEPAGVGLLRSRLLPLVDWVTPNLDELALLTGQPIVSHEQMAAAAVMLQQEILRQGSRVHVLAKGGHLDESGAMPSAFDAPLHPRSDDLLLTREGERNWLAGERIATRSTHGTGCALSSALLSRLVLGDMPIVAVEAAKRYVEGALRNAEPIGHGHGPMNHLWSLRRG
jgi:hydroxymethylpyrimidine/phosphomethylpyrimidine kinase